MNRSTVTVWARVHSRELGHVFSVVEPISFSKENQHYDLLFCVKTDILYMHIITSLSSNKQEWKQEEQPMSFSTAAYSRSLWEVYCNLSVVSSVYSKVHSHTEKHLGEASSSGAKLGFLTVEEHHKPLELLHCWFCQAYRAILWRKLILVVCIQNLIISIRML